MTLLREELPEDIPEIGALLLEAFGGTVEAELVERLRADGDVELALVAEEAGRVVGHLVLSRMQTPQRALALAPLAVLPAFQRRGIGGELVRASLAAAREQNASAVFVLGETSFYGRFGFAGEAAARFRSPCAGPHFMAASFGARPGSQSTRTQPCASRRSCGVKRAL